MMPLKSYIWVILFTSILFFACISGSTYESFDTSTSNTSEKHLEDAYNQTKVQYHPPEDQIKSMYGFTQEYTNIIRDDGTQTKIPYHKTQGSLLYYTPGSKPYEDYQMDYADAIALSKL